MNPPTIKSVRTLTGEMVCVVGKSGGATKHKIQECLACIADDGYVNKLGSVIENKDGSHTVRYYSEEDPDAEP